MENWPDDDLDLVIDESRRQLDAQFARLESVTGRAQLVLATDLTIIALLVAGLHTLVSGGGFLAFAAWITAIIFISLSLLGSAAVIVVRKDMGAVNAAAVSTLAPPIRLKLARSYTRAIGKGEQTIAREVTVSRDAVLLTLIAVLIYGGAWCVAIAG